jgi:hypothetical protein
MHLLHRINLLKGDAEHAEVAELVDALGSGSSRCTAVGVRVSPSAPFIKLSRIHDNHKWMRLFFVQPIGRKIPLVPQDVQNAVPPGDFKPRQAAISRAVGGDGKSYGFRSGRLGVCYENRQIALSSRYAPAQFECCAQWLLYSILHNLKKMHKYGPLYSTSRLLIEPRPWNVNEAHRQKQ